MPMLGSADALAALFLTYDDPFKEPKSSRPRNSIIAFTVAFRRLSSHAVSSVDKLDPLRIDGLFTGQTSPRGVYPSGALGNALLEWNEDVAISESRCRLAVFPSHISRSSDEWLLLGSPYTPSHVVTRKRSMNGFGNFMRIESSQGFEYIA